MLLRNKIIVGLCLALPLLFFPLSDKCKAADEPENATYTGIEPTTVTLNNGLWEGEPYVTGGHVRPRIGLVQDFSLQKKGTEKGTEQLAFLWRSTGGSGVLTYMALLRKSRTGLENTSTVLLGDRVQLRSGTFSKNSVSVNLVQGGPKDPACCPSQLAARKWVIEDGKLIEQLTEVTGTLSPKVLGTSIWQLSKLTGAAPLTDHPRVTLTYSEGKFVGTGGCNNYSASVSEGTLPGEIHIGPVISTRKACPDPIAASEHTYLKLLQNVHRFAFLNSRLLLSWQDETSSGTLQFNRSDEETE